MESNTFFLILMIFIDFDIIFKKPKIDFQGVPMCGLM